MKLRIGKAKVNISSYATTRVHQCLFSALSKSIRLQVKSCGKGETERKHDNGCCVLLNEINIGMKLRSSRLKMHQYRFLGYK